MKTNIKEIIIQADGSDCFWSPEGLIGLDELGRGDLSKLSKEFSDWGMKKELKFPNFDGFDWKSYHEKGIGLSRKLKKVVGSSVRIIYRKSPDDPKYQVDEYTEIK
ncbi:MAG TPA: hypothetical protein DET40_04890 [Lentisphaeria bacterium]|nr:MAG: hypothetical protein A2X45_13465 [Lentisphaerae bacterium GWF2_50_93]HCE42862.1 hypothetical protein [Lentisphaeria bacterium]